MERKDFESQNHLNDATYTALGHIVVNFSLLLHTLEHSTAQYIAGRDGGKYLLLGAAWGDRTASPIVSAFFSVFYQYWENSVSDNDGKVMKALRSEIDAVVEKRNRLMHEYWGDPSVGGEEGPHEMSRLRVRAHGKGVEYVSIDESPEGLNAFASDINGLVTIIHRIVFYFHPNQAGPEVHSRFLIENGKVTVRPLA